MGHYISYKYSTLLIAYMILIQNLRNKMNGYNLEKRMDFDRAVLQKVF